MQEQKVLGQRSALHNSKSVFTESELRYCRTKKEPESTLAGIFSAKEAFVKAVSGLIDFPRFAFTDVQILHAPNGRPYFAFARRIDDFLRQGKWHTDVTISHTAGVAAAFVLLWSDDHCHHLHVR